MYTIKCSFIEIYKETIRDLLDPKATKLRVRENPVTGVWIAGVTEQVLLIVTLFLILIYEIDCLVGDC